MVGLTLFIGEPSDLNPTKFALVIGNARSGTTIIGSILDAHPRMICANETGASISQWLNLTRDGILADLLSNCEVAHATNRPSSGYFYAISTPPKSVSAIDVVGDKIFNPTLLMLHGDNNLLSRLSETMACQIFVVHCVRNPFDVIATMHHRSGASLLNRTRWYFMHCEAAQALIERAELNIATFYHEDFSGRRTDQVVRLYAFLGHYAPPEVIERVRAVLFNKPRRTRDLIEWPADVVDEVTQQMSRFPFLQRYSRSLVAEPAAAEADRQPA